MEIGIAEVVSGGWIALEDGYILKSDVCKHNNY